MAKHRDLHGKIRIAAANCELDEGIVFKIALGMKVPGGVDRERAAAALRALGVGVPVLTTADELEGAPARANGGGS